MISRTLGVAALTLLTSLAGCKKESDSGSKAPSEAKQEKAESTSGVDTAAQPAANPTVSLVEAEAGGSYSVDPAHTRALFKIKHFDVSYQYGMFTGIEGSFAIDADDISKSKVSMKIPTGSVFTAIKKRDDHLRSPDFFDAKQFPEITFESKQVEAVGNNTYKVTGPLTMHGVTKDITIELEHVGSAKDPEPMGGAFRTGFNGEATIKRSEWGMDYMQGAGLSDEVTLIFSIEGTRKG